MKFAPLKYAIEDIPLKPYIDNKEIEDLLAENKIEFTLVGPEVPLAYGIVDQFRAQDLKIWGPTQYCAQLESSKSFAKNFMIKYNIPTAKFVTFENGNEAKEYLRTGSFPIVIKADGLAAGGPP